MRPSTSDDCSTDLGPPARPRTTYASLPPELWHEILGLVPDALLQRTTAALLAALGPTATAVDRALLYRHLVVGRPGQLGALVDELAAWDDALQLATSVDGNDCDDGDDSEQQQADERRRRHRPPSRSFRLTSWHPSPSLVLTALDRLPELSLLALNVGTPFAPEHVEQALERPRPSLSQLELRFRPYVDRASYHQFLAGAYFDTALEALARWPPAATSGADASDGGSLTRLSIVQDVAPRHLVDASVGAKPVRAGPSLSTALSSLTSSSSAPDAEGEGEAGESPEARAERERLERRRMEDIRGRGRYTGHGPFPYLDGRLAGSQPKIFAQPIVFFALSCVSELACSPAVRAVTHLRLRIPLRDVVPSLVLPPATIGADGPFPNLRHLDLSTTNVRLHLHLPKLLDCFRKLETVVLDHTNLFGFLGADRQKGRECAAELGKLVAGHGVGRAKTRERELAREAERRWRASRARTAAGPLAENETGDDDDGQQRQFADELTRLTTEEYPSNGTGRRRVVRSMAHSTFSLRSTAPTGRPGGPLLPPAPLEAYHPTVQAFILPPLPSLRSIALGGEAPLSASDRRAWSADFAQGWCEGLARVAEHALRVVGERVERAARKAEGERLALDRWLEKHGHGDDRTAAAAKPAAAAVPKDTKGKGRASAAGRLPSTTAANGQTVNGGGGTRPLPPAQVILYRYLTPDESPSPTPDDADASPVGLAVVDRSTDWRTPYLNLLGLTPATLADAPEGCTLCLVPNELEGPVRRAGAESSSTLATSVVPTGQATAAAADSDGEDDGGGDDEVDDGSEVEDGRVGGGAESSLASAHVPCCGHLAGRAIWAEQS